MPLNGTLRDLSLPGLIQLQCSEQRQTRVQLRDAHAQASREGTLIFAAGELIFAQAGTLLGDEAVYELLSWEDGEFQVSDGLETLPPGNVQTPWSALLLEGLRRVDEARAEHNAALEAQLNGMIGQHGMRAALVVGVAGALRAATSGDSRPADAALITFIVQRAHTVAAALDLGRFEQLVCTAPTEKIFVASRADAYLASWLEGRAALEPLKAALQALNGFPRQVSQVPDG